MSKELSFVCSKDEESQRLDRYLKRKIQNINQAIIEKNIRKKLILVNKCKTSSNYRVLENDIVEILFDANFKEENISEKKLQNLKNTFIKDKLVIFEDDDFCVINKPYGLASQLGTNQNLSIDSIFYEHKLVHRLDKETTGIMLLAKNLKTSWFFQEKFKKKEIHKTYLAIVEGIIKNDFGVINAPLLKNDQKVCVSNEGLEAITKYEVVKRSSNMTVVKFFPLTGRMHQIRVHSNYIGHSIIGDSKYGKQSFSNKLHLHALEIEFEHFNKKKLNFKAEIPNHIDKTIKDFFE